MDVVSGLGDSCDGKWNGDVDLNDARLFEEYTCRLEFIAELRLARMAIHHIETDLALLETNLKDVSCVVICACVRYECGVIVNTIVL